jgi:hypothetical protein
MHDQPTIGEEINEALSGRVHEGLHLLDDKHPNDDLSRDEDHRAG